MDEQRFDEKYQTMTEAVEVGASLAWRLLATLEGGSLIIATSALLAYTARNRMVRRRRRNVRSVLISNTTNELGKELKTKLESLGYTVSSAADQVKSVSGAVSGAGAGEVMSRAGSASVATDADEDRVDALVVVGAQPAPAASGLDGMAALVTEDVHNNLTLLDRLSARVRRGGCVAWACAGATRGSFSGAAEAFDAALRASLQHAAKSCHCEPIWVGRCETTQIAVEKIVSELVTCTNLQPDSRFSIRNTAVKVSGYVGRWLKIIT